MFQHLAKAFPLTIATVTEFSHPAAPNLGCRLVRGETFAANTRNTELAVKMHCKKMLCKKMISKKMLALLVCCTLFAADTARAQMGSADPRRGQELAQRLAGRIIVPHPPMPNIELTIREMRDIIEYIISLKDRR